VGGVSLRADARQAPEEVRAPIIEKVEREGLSSTQAKHVVERIKDRPEDTDAILKEPYTPPQLVRCGFSTVEGYDYGSYDPKYVDGVPICSYHQELLEKNPELLKELTRDVGKAVRGRDPEATGAGEEAERWRDVLAANQQIRQGQLAKEVSAVWYTRHLLPLLRENPERAFVLTAPVQNRVIFQGFTVSHQLNTSFVPRAVTSGPARRVLRPGGRIMKDESHWTMERRK